MTPEDQERIDAAIQTAETINERIGEATDAAETATGAAEDAGRDAGRAEAAAGSAGESVGRAITAETVSVDAAKVATAQSSLIGTPVGNPLGWQFSRDSVRIGWDARGNLEEVAPDQAQGGYSRAGTYLGLLINKARRNYAANPNMLGAGAGTLLGGAASPPFPSGWATPTRNAGVSIDVTPITALGRPGLRLRFYASAALTSITVDAIEMAARGAIAAATGQNWCVAFWYRLVAGSLPVGVTFRSRILSRNASGGAVNNVNQTLTLDSAWRLAEHVQVMGTAVTDVTGGMQVSWTAGVTPNFTIEIVAPDLFQGTRGILPALPPVASLGPYTREQDAITVPATVLGGNLDRVRGSFFATLTSYYPIIGTNAADWSGVFSLGDGSAANLIGLAINPGFTSIEARLISAGVANDVAAVAMTAPLDGSPFKIGMSWGDGFIQVFSRGAYSPQVPIAVGTPLVTQAMIGRLASIVGFDGSLSTLDLRPAPVWNAVGAALAA